MRGIDVTKREKRRPTGRRIGVLGCALVAALGVARAADPDFSAEERRRLARFTPLPAEGPLDPARVAAVTFVDLSPKAVPDFSDADCRAVGRLPKLTSFTLRDLPATAACVDALPRTPIAVTLERVGFAPGTLAALGRMPGLVGLRIMGGTGLSARLIDAFPPSSRLVRVTVDGVDGETLAALRRVGTLGDLEIGAVIGEQGLAPLDGAPELERLMMPNATAGDLAVIARLPRLAELVTGIDDGASEADLRRLATSTTLKTVSLQFSERRGSAGVGALAEMPHLDALKLVYQTVADRDLARLALSRSLTSLDLREATVTEAGLLGLTKSRSLKSIDLRLVEISERTRRRLAKRFVLD